MKMVITLEKKLANHKIMLNFNTVYNSFNFQK